MVILRLRGGIGRGRVGGFAEGPKNHGGDNAGEVCALNHEREGSELDDKRRPNGSSSLENKKI